MIKYEYIDAAAISGARFTIERPDEAALADTYRALQTLTPMARINALRDTPELESRIAELLAQHAEVFPHGAAPRVVKSAGRTMVKPAMVKSEVARMALLAAIRDAELIRVALKARPHIEKSVRYSESQRARRLGKPGTSDWEIDAGRNGRIRAAHSRAAGARGTIKRLAAEFGLSEKQIARIVRNRT